MRARTTTDDRTRKRLLAIEVLLEDPEAIPDPLEAELYAYRDQLRALKPRRQIAGRKSWPSGFDSAEGLTAYDRSNLQQ